MAVPLHLTPGGVGEAPVAHPDGNIRYQLKTPYPDGITHVIFEPAITAYLPPTVETAPR
jgi:hypothetical protein